MGQINMVSLLDALVCGNIDSLSELLGSKYKDYVELYDIVKSITNMGGIVNKVNYVANTDGDALAIELFISGEIDLKDITSDTNNIKLDINGIRIDGETRVNISIIGGE